MQASPDQAETHTLRGATDRPALLTIHDIIEEMEPLATPQLDDYLNPSVLEVTLDDGLCEADEARIDIQWTTRDDYKFHYTDTEGVNFRWGNHPHAGDYIHATGPEHYHPPPDASSDPGEVEESCIIQSPEELVTRAVLKLWRVAYHTDSYEPLNAGSNPP
ncbi:toxin-antitoxin system TumE family protein [Halomicrobium salinisoli]|uniref:toxin-antitoxin system TumE family protein n=1 Tax=Halomicrobium salinisoli TaxID=2878391 RepID=UPI001CF08408|nr:DUF6516 family protein [Halomicrobium salinisoli]